MADRWSGRLAALLLPVAMGSLACDTIPARQTVGGWPAGESVRVGACEFTLQQAALYHSTEWHLEVELLVRNPGPESAHCAFSARAVTASGTALTDATEVGLELGPEQEEVREAAAREANMTGMSTGTAEGAWVYLELSEGHWPTATRTGVSVDPERVRPPD